MYKLLCVGLGGFIGTSLRYCISISASKLLRTQIPYGTLFVNVLGGTITVNRTL
ncbi:camphor resistance protein-like protein [Gottschalkia acidurici 9a]|uniref:Camphor resistance protein-like protein n=1 Tax=Gottschalkia acidurici (strain ATCC 7906 / DSM 604 / BCRC 14475 / CIP 104303 / KCTC 5404 / NCIMB 10678 / 9a) TaxID=1128398 RepID=K0B2H6_GOTA9|nr:camphor resistance protein-like protein [Gottschalkia acidurici]AFS79312.1 camphor resistance protein-like protein [Gottschalkia acidurici 9a]